MLSLHNYCCLIDHSSRLRVSGIETFLLKSLYRITSSINLLANYFGVLDRPRWCWQVRRSIPILVTPSHEQQQVAFFPDARCKNCSREISNPTIIGIQRIHNSGHLCPRHQRKLMQHEECFRAAWAYADGEGKDGQNCECVGSRVSNLRRNSCATWKKQTPTVAPRMRAALARMCSCVTRCVGWWNSKVERFWNSNQAFALKVLTKNNVQHRHLLQLIMSLTFDNTVRFLCLLCFDHTAKNNNLQSGQKANGARAHAPGVDSITEQVEKQASDWTASHTQPSVELWRVLLAGRTEVSGRQTAQNAKPVTIFVRSDFEISKKLQALNEQVDFKVTTVMYTATE